MERFRCCHSHDFSIEKERYKEEGLETQTSEEQKNVEESISHYFKYFAARSHAEKESFDLPSLKRDQHLLFLKKGLQHLSNSYECLDASRSWLCYWILHSLELLDEHVSNDEITLISQFLKRCQCSSGGFGGGPGQYAHLATTYAAVNALCILGTEDAFKVINREKLYSFLMRMKNGDGSFRMHEGGEVDVRGAYCAASVARLTNIVTPELFDGTPEWITSCQTYEGGFGGYPGLEAHGGYSFCGLAALVILGHGKLCNVEKLLRWTVNRQMRYEGGFQGRTNKLVDGCYSFWQGGALPLIHMVLAQEHNDNLSSEKWMFDQDALQEYLLLCCQYAGGGLIDKPGKARDYYHTCYCLSGLAIAQHFAGGKIAHLNVLGDPRNELKPTHPVFNIGIDAVTHATLYFDRLPIPSSP